LLELDSVRERAKAYDPATLTYPWEHVDARVDRLQSEVMRTVGVRSTRSRDEIFDQVCALAGVSRQRDTSIPARTAIPYLNEPWYC
jgi:hypothetical protein